ncbi:hypothetical protein CES85_5216 [Ochrobactrum quorumnocens]|uniref:Uncharacterized protein n=1 Tax=Ochrobactrum quorumnocens TaxID=271865 RepID=A0A248UCT8_9HYPH|nr:hypothetical protein CES85_5216 [[Ochrobactrum] quorumnocens]
MALRLPNRIPIAKKAKKPKKERYERRMTYCPDNDGMN